MKYSQLWVIALLNSFWEFQLGYWSKFWNCWFTGWLLDEWHDYFNLLVQLKHHCSQLSFCWPNFELIQLCQDFPKFAENSLKKQCPFWYCWLLRFIFFYLIATLNSSYVFYFVILAYQQGLLASFRGWSFQFLYHMQVSSLQFSLFTLNLAFSRLQVRQQLQLAPFISLFILFSIIQVPPSFALVWEVPLLFKRFECICCSRVWIRCHSFG